MRTVRLLLAGFGALVLALNLSMIRLSLVLTAPPRPEVTAKLVRAGVVAILIGFAIVAVGLALSFWRRPTQERVTIVGTGSSVTAIGVAYVVRSVGYPDQGVILVWAWLAAVVGAAFIAWYLLIPPPRKARRRSHDPHEGPVPPAWRAAAIAVALVAGCCVFSALTTRHRRHRRSNLG